MRGPFDPSREPFDPFLEWEDMADPLDPFQAGPGQGLDDPFLLDDSMQAMEPDPLAGPLGGPLGIYDLLDQVEGSVPIETNLTSPFDRLDELERTIESNSSTEVFDPWEDRVLSQPQTPLVEGPRESAIPDGIRYHTVAETGRRIDRLPPVKMWRPRVSSGAILVSPSKYEGHETVRMCPRSDEMVTTEECEACEEFREGGCQWEGEETNGQEHGSE
jgi:hypothetical protein